MTKQWLWLICRAILFSGIINLPGLLQYQSSSGIARSLLPVDESLYLEKALQVASLKSSGFYSADFNYFELDVQKPLSEVIFSRPNALVDYAVGSLGNLLGFSAPELALFLDFVCVALSYFVFAVAFGRLTSRPMFAEVAAVVLIRLPYLLIINSDFSIFSTIFAPIFGHAFVVYGDYDLPAFRAVYTQVGYPLFGFCLLLTFRAASSAVLRVRDWIILGLFAGLAGYVYFFTWIVTAALALVMLGVRSVYDYQVKNLSIPQVAKALTGFLIAYVVVSAPAIFCLNQSGIRGIITAPELSKYFFFSWLVVLEIVALLVVLFWGQRKLNRYLLLGGSIGCLLLELILMNLQPILGQAIAPYHFPRFYTQPLFSGLCILLFLNRCYQRQMRWLPEIVAIILFLMIGLRLMEAIPYAEDRDELEFKSLVEFLREGISPRSVVAVMSDLKPFRQEVGETFTHSLMPNLLYAFTHQYVLHQDWQYTSIDAVDNVKRELALGWIFSGKVQLVWPCVSTIDHSGDLFYGTWTFYKLRRRHICSVYGEVIQNYTPCQIIKDFKIDYLLWERTLEFEKWFVTNSAFQKIWESPQGQYELFALRQETARINFCDELQVLPAQ